MTMFSELSGLQLLMVFGSLLIAMSTHEAMHAFTSHWLGDSTAHDMGRLTLNPLKHIDIITTVLLPVLLIAAGLPPIFAAKPVPFNPNRVKWDEFGVALIGLAGPLTNLALACIGGLIFRLGDITSNSLANAVEIFTLVNVSLFIFNLIPFPPLDGSRVLYAFAPEPLQKVMATIESYGFLTLLMFMVIVFNFAGQGIINLNYNLLRFILGV